MAIAGIQSVSVLDSSFLRESPSQTPRQMTMASPLFRMWRELEDEHVVSRARDRVREEQFQQRTDGFGVDLVKTDCSESAESEHSGESEDASAGENECSIWSEGRIGSLNDHEVSSSNNSEHSSDLGEVERGRVRQVFQDWMNSGATECASGVSHINGRSQAEWLGETEQERVRVIREWVQMKGTSGSSRGNRPVELGTQTEQVRNGSVVNQFEGRNQHLRKGIRKLCGRQALLDMVKKAEMERKTEIESLIEHRAVTNFPHRNRIQSLLRGWFLRNGRVTTSERPSSVAEQELGILRQKQSVSGLREGFCFRLDSPVTAQESSSFSCTSANYDSVLNRPEQSLENNSYEVVNDSSEQSEYHYEGSDEQEHESRGTSDDSNDLGGNSDELVNMQQPISHVVPDNSRVREWQWSASPERIERRGSPEQNTGIGTLENSYIEHRTMEESDYATNDQSEPSREAVDFPSVSDYAEIPQGSTTHNASRLESATTELQQWPDRSSDSEERDWEQDVAEYTEWREGIRENADYGRENSQLEEPSEEWHGEGGFQEVVQSWLEVPSDREAVPAIQEDPYFFQDNDSVYSTELRELLSRRRVSNIHSGFRDSLNQLIQSYVERQGNGSPPSESADQDLEQPNEDHDEALVDSVPDRSVSLPLQPIIPSPSTWDQDSNYDHWPQQETHQPLGIEWDVINDMRVDMARLQHRMNNLQRMLETCMDMQLELQRSIRQEVSAALNRSGSSPGSFEADAGSAHDESKWDHVRKGICCVCRENNIDSLLYRCGHMCTCEKCADELVVGRGSCPMCRAPVIEVVRAYSIL